KRQAQSGPLLITHWGMSGPSIIKLSAWSAEVLFDANYMIDLFVNWLPNWGEGEIRDQLKKGIGGMSPFSEIPRRLWRYLLSRTNITPNQPGTTISQKQVNRLTQELSQGVFSVTGKGPFKEEFVTCGGVRLKEVNFKSMESNLCEDLYIVGELLNIDGVTGGFNFQNAWTTGYISSRKN
ncbi:MAG: NAD(P)/FAD-dependent oxidoreductase, partial [Candidatus Margulisbacteria bacterium]|nr:NAD(P)/FAD-dependent oxidoreductase [Candidatus Margulisiibacteriota bacterium]